MILILWDREKREIYDKSKFLNIYVLELRTNFHRVKVYSWTRYRVLVDLFERILGKFDRALTEGEGNEPNPSQSDRSSLNDVPISPPFLAPRFSNQNSKFIARFLLLFNVSLSSDDVPSIFANSCEINKRNESFR